MLALLIVLFAGLCYVIQTWPDVTYAELVYHLKTSFGGTNPEMVYSALLTYGLPALIGVAAVIAILVLISKKNRLIYTIASIVAIVALVVLDGANAYAFNKRTKVLSDFYKSTFSKNDSDFIGNIYVDPLDVKIEFPEQKRNLIYIYLESMETAYTDKANGGYFDDDYIPNLTKLSQENENFSGDTNELNGGYSLPGTNWTAGAMFAHASGLPLDLPVHEASISSPEQFFPTTVTLGDILKDEGYVNVIEMGSDIDFAGKRNYYVRHGDYQIHDYYYAIEEGYIPEDYQVFWGYEDEKLFEFTKKELLELAQGEQPFNYTMITVDTHCQDGYVCRLCEDEYGDNQYANVISCSDRQVTEFVEWLQQQEFYENTTVVLVGDHTTMDADFIEDNNDYPRKTYTCILNSAAETELNTRREYTTLDMFPTTLAALGVKMSSDRLGCGTNLYSSQQTIIEEYGKDYVWDEFSMNSPFVESLVILKVNEDTIKNAQNEAYLEAADEDGLIRFRLKQVDSINCQNITSLTLSVHNNVSGEDNEYEIERDVLRSGWQGVLHSDIPFGEVENLDCKVYISSEDLDHYLLLDVPNNQLKMWDIHWDLE